jgi:hypothetical protein
MAGRRVNNGVVNGHGHPGTPFLWAEAVPLTGPTRSQSRQDGEKSAGTIRETVAVPLIFCATWDIQDK